MRCLRDLAFASVERNTPDAFRKGESRVRGGSWWFHGQRGESRLMLVFKDGQVEFYKRTPRDERWADAYQRVFLIAEPGFDRRLTAEVQKHGIELAADWMSPG